MLQQFYPTPNHSYRFELNKDMHFAAAHFLPNEKAGICQQMHGHTYFANITIAGNELDDCGFLVNFKSIKQLIHGSYDHTLLNDHEEFKNISPSTELFSKIVWKKIQNYLSELPHKPRCIQVLIRETPSSYVRYVPQAEDFI